MADIVAILARGNISSLSEEEKTQYYLELCYALKLDPRFRPVDFIEGKGNSLTPYLNKGATDALARAGSIQRITVVQPKVIELDSVKCVMCVARATDPSGRYEERIATALLRNHENILMRVETKAYRRATLAVLGIGMLDESELDGIRGADALAEGARALALEAHVQAAVERITLELPTVTDTSMEARRARWETHTARLAEEASVTHKEAKAVLLAAMKR